jgi:AcrR family transcriptional regulator
MNHQPSHLLSAEAQPLTRRAIAKLKTRQSLLAAGKLLFSERGYEAATVRDIAAAADMSTGAVFANFADKADLFSEILASDQDAVAAKMRRAAQGPGSTAQRLAATFAAGYAFNTEQLALFQAAQARAWTHEPAAEVRAQASVRQITAIIRDLLQQGIDKRELRSGFDIELAADILWQAYLANYRLAAFDGFSVEQLGRRMERQIDLVLKAGLA